MYLYIYKIFVDGIKKKWTNNEIKVFFKDVNKPFLKRV